MKKSVKKVLAALLSVLLFASLFTTTAFADGASDLAAAKDKLNTALANFYGSVGNAWVSVNTDAIYANYMAKVDAAAAKWAEENPFLAMLVWSEGAVTVYKDGVEIHQYYADKAAASAAVFYENVAANVDAVTEAYVANVNAFLANLKK